MTTPTRETEIDLRSTLAVLGRSWRALLLAVVVGGGGGALFVLLSPPIYRAQMSLLTITENDATAALSAASILPGAPDPQLILKGVVLSNSSLSEISKATGIEKKDLEEGLILETDGPRAQVAISWEDRDSKLALKVIESARNTLSDLQKKVAFTSARQEANNIEAAIKQKDGELARAEAALAEYQRTMKAPIAANDLSSVALYFRQKKDLEMQLGTAKRQLAQAQQRANITADQAELPNAVPTAQVWRQKLGETEHQLRVLEISKGPLDPEVVRLKKEVAETKSRLQREVQDYLMSVREGIDAGVASFQAQIVVLEWQIAQIEETYKNAPEEAIELTRRAREVETLGAVLQELRLQYEKAKVRAEVDRVRWSVLDDPYLFDRPTNKRYVRTAGLAALVLGLLAAFAIVLRSRPGRA
ncbi:MAG: hypothetical protein KIS66_05965 [Fimbriimonadaceae bacterium]|nr:hypothetical protein [Fimbriimonadaceae bacterium]